VHVAALFARKSRVISRHHHTRIGIDATGGNSRVQFLEPATLNLGGTG
jgi:hypothetical protein